MKYIRELKKELGDKYNFERRLSLRQVRKLISENITDVIPQTVQALTVGCVRIELCIYKQNGSIYLAYDIFVKDSPDSYEWIYYDSPHCKISFKEADMYAELERIVRKDGLSYTECCFEKLEGRQEEAEKGTRAPV